MLEHLALIAPRQQESHEKKCGVDTTFNNLMALLFPTFGNFSKSHAGPIVKHAALILLVKIFISSGNNTTEFLMNLTIFYIYNCLH